MPNIQLANNLRYLRKTRGLTQNELSEMLNISRQAYSNYETSKRTPDLDALLYLAQFYEVTLDELVLLSLEALDSPSLAGGIAETRVPYTLSVNKNTGNTLYITGEEQDLLKGFRTLSQENKQIITGFMHTNAKHSD